MTLTQYSTITDSAFTEVLKAVPVIMPVVGMVVAFSVVIAIWRYISR